jgi:predicted O-linked N-acetylglucosamine transferase (SPINDLY family)
MTSPADVFPLALQHHRAGDLHRAEHLYRHLLHHDAAHADAWHLLGVLASQRGQPELALHYIGQALTLRPSVAPFHLNRGVALQALGRLDEAVASFRQALALRPDWAEAHNNLANALHSLGQREAAIDHWGHAIKCQPHYPEAHNNLAVALHEHGRHEEAAAHAREAIGLRPDFAQAHFHLGNALSELMRYDEAETAYREALRLQPAWPVAHCNLGRALRLQGRPEDALLSLREALRFQPDYAPALDEAGVTLSCLGRLDEAAAHLLQALRLQPGYAEAHNNLGVLLNGRRRFAQAADHFRQAARLQPDLLDATINLAGALDRQGQPDEAEATLREALGRSPGHAGLHARLGEVLSHQGRRDESGAAFREALRLQPDLASTHSSLLIDLNFDPQLDPAALLAEHRRWEALHAQVPRLGPAPDHDRTPDRRLRVGYVSPDLIQHVLVHFLEPILAHHDPRRVEAVCYADVLVPDRMTDRLRSLAHRWRPTGACSDDHLARQVREDGIDILVDLAGHTGDRLGVFARQPAPVQVTYLGYPNTTGLGSIHYRLTDAVADPPGEPPCHTEELVRLPGGFCCYAPPEAAPAVTAPPSQSQGFVTFGSLHKLAKLNGDVLDLWCAVLRALPSARLLVFREALRGSARDYFRHQFARRGVAGERLVLRHEVAENETFLSVYRDVDVLFDTFPWSGHATACEALWMGVPVVSLLGNRHAGRMVASVLTRLGLTELIARTAEDFVARAVELANDPNRLACLRGGLRERMRASPLCDGRQFTRQLEAAYRDIWLRWVRGESPGTG